MRGAARGNKVAGSQRRVQAVKLHDHVVEKYLHDLRVELAIPSQVADGLCGDKAGQGVCGGEWHGGSS